MSTDGRDLCRGGRTGAATSGTPVAGANEAGGRAKLGEGMLDEEEEVEIAEMGSGRLEEEEEPVR